MMKFLAFGTESRRVARTVSVPFAHALATAATPNELPPHVLEQGVRQVREFVDLASTVGVPRERVTAICTAIFRRAANGREFVERVAREVPGVDIRIISQSAEARIGALTALRAFAVEPDVDRIISLDAGGASFQIAVASEAATDELQAYDGPHGSVTSLTELFANRGSSTLRSPNPVQLAEIEPLVTRLAASFPPRPQWLADTRELPVVAIGDATSSFAVVARETGSNQLTRAGVEAALRSTCGLTDDEILARNHPQPELCASKLALLLSFFDLLGRDRTINYVQTEGSCLGVLAMFQSSPPP